jgi:hypothetical protein
MTPKFAETILAEVQRQFAEGMPESESARWAEQESSKNAQEYHPEGPKIIFETYHAVEAQARAMPADPAKGGLSPAQTRDLTDSQVRFPHDGPPFTDGNTDRLTVSDDETPLTPDEIHALGEIPDRFAMPEAGGESPKTTLTDPFGPDGPVRKAISATRDTLAANIANHATTAPAGEPPKAKHKKK